MESDAIPSPEPETGGAQPESIAKFARVVVDRPKGIGSHLCKPGTEAILPATETGSGRIRSYPAFQVTMPGGQV